jgi:hypothetical protein
MSAALALLPVRTFACDTDAWDVVAGNQPAVWAPEVARVDLAYWQVRGARPTAERLARRWGWSEARVVAFLSARGAR